MDLNCIIVCVDYYDILAYTLSYNREHFNRVVVVTSPFDPKTRKVALDNDSTPFITDAFYAKGAYFNKFLALERGLDFLGRTGWIVVMDADIVWPKEAKMWLEVGAIPGNLYVPYRRMMEDHFSLNCRGIPSENLWQSYKLHPGKEFAGYSQIFHAGSSCLATLPWYESFISAGTGDSFFQNKWTTERRIRPPWEVLHVGRSGTNWCGRTEPMVDGSPAKDAILKQSRLRDMLSRRATNPTNDRYRHERIQ